MSRAFPFACSTLLALAGCVGEPAARMPDVSPPMARAPEPVPTLPPIDGVPPETVAGDGIYSRVPSGTWALLRLSTLPEEYQESEAGGRISQMKAWVLPDEGVTRMVYATGSWQEATDDFEARVAIYPGILEGDDVSGRYIDTGVGFSPGAEVPREERILVAWFEGGNGTIGLSRTSWSDSRNATEVQPTLAGSTAIGGMFTRIVEQQGSRVWTAGTVDWEEDVPRPGQHRLEVGADARLERHGFAVLHLSIVRDSLGASEWGYRLSSPAADAAARSRDLDPGLLPPAAAEPLGFAAPRLTTAVPAKGDLRIQFERTLTGREGLERNDAELVVWAAFDADLEGSLGWPLRELGDSGGPALGHWLHTAPVPPPS